MQNWTERVPKMTLFCCENKGMEKKNGIKTLLQNHTIYLQNLHNYYKKYNSYEDSMIFYLRAIIQE